MRNFSDDFQARLDALKGKPAPLEKDAFFYWWMWRVQHPFFPWMEASKVEQLLFKGPVLGTFIPGPPKLSEELMRKILSIHTPANLYQLNYLTHMLFSFDLTVPMDMKERILNGFTD